MKTKVLFISLLFCGGLVYSQMTISTKFMNIYNYGLFLGEFSNAHTFTFDASKKEFTTDTNLFLGNNICNEAKLSRLEKNPNTFYISCNYMDEKEPDENKRIMSLKKAFIIIDSKSLVISTDEGHTIYYN